MTAIVRALPGFAWGVLKSFRANQGLLLAGAVAYYTLLSLVPGLILLLVGLTRFIDPTLLLNTIGDYLEFLVPGQSTALVDQLRGFLGRRDLVGGILLVSMLIFSAMAFTVLENAMSVIFYHRVAIRRRHFLMSAVIPYLFILCLGVGLLSATTVSGKLAVLATRDVDWLGVPHSLQQLSNYLLYLMGVGSEILVLTAIYLVMPVGRVSWRHALVGGVTAGLLWEITRHVLVWYFGTISQVQIVYGTFATAIALLLSVEIAAVLLLLGAQVIANYEQLYVRKKGDREPSPMKTTRVKP
ncbi:MAG: YihY/virulence factor BrkB family protein [Betaproteobacteria bacterium]